MILQGDALNVLRTLPDASVQMCVTSPPYHALRDYGVDGQIGLEQSPDEYIARLVEVFREVRRVLRADGTLWLNIGDSYAGSGKGRMADGAACATGKQTTNRGSVAGTLKKAPTAGCKPKDLIGIPWMLAFALRADGWYLRQDIIWQKPNCMPESVRDRCTKSHEYIFLLSKSPRYYFDAEAIAERRVGENNAPIAGSAGAFGSQQSRRRGSGNKLRKFRPTPNTPHFGGNIPYSGEQRMRNRRDVWTVATAPYKGAHFATFPEKLVKPCILAGSREGDAVLDPFSGAATTGVVCKRLGREYIGIELNPAYVALGEKRIAETPDFSEQQNLFA